jgi:hypothetical protein
MSNTVRVERGDEFEVSQLEEWLSFIMERRRNSNNVDYNDGSFFNYDALLNWISLIQDQLKTRTELANLHLLSDHINTQPWSCSVDDPEHQHREIGIALLTTLALRQQYPNFAGVGGWISSSHEPLGVPQKVDRVNSLSKTSTDIKSNRSMVSKLLRGVTHNSGLNQVRDHNSLVPKPMIRDLAIREKIEGMNIREAFTKFTLKYSTALQLIVQLSAALFMGWKHLRLQFDRLDWDTIMLRHTGVRDAFINYEGCKLRCDYVVTITDYRTASASYNNRNYYMSGNKVELTQLIYELASITSGECYQALQDVYQYLVEHSVYHDNWFREFIRYGLKNWNVINELIVKDGIELVKMPVKNLKENVGHVDDENSDYMIDLIQDLYQSTWDDLEDLLIVKNWEPFEIKWEALRRNTIHLAYIEETMEDADDKDELAKFNRKLYKNIEKHKRKLNHHYLIFKFNHPTRIPGYMEMIRDRMAKLGYKVMVQK